MSKIKQKAPKLRFPEFTDDWEQRKLGDIGIAKSGVGFPDVEQGGSKGTPFFKVSDMNTDGNENELVIANNYVTDEQISRKRWNVVTDVPAIFFAKVGAAVMLNRKRLVRFPFLLDNNTMAYIFDKEVWDCDFGKTLFETIDLTKLTQLGALPSYNSSDVEEIEIYIPLKVEQKCIGSYFKQLDNLITLHQRKCDELKEFKKGMFQKMFPKKGETIPEIRFPGFTDAWEQRKLGDIAEFSKGSGYSKGDLIESGTPIILYGRLYTKYETSISEVDTYVEAKDGSVYSKGGEVIIPASGETAEDIARAATVDKSGVILGGDLNVVSPNEDINSAFLAISISHGNSQRELAKKAQGKSVVHIHNEEIKNLVVPFPAKAEQNKIVEYFSNLDDLITLHQRKVDEYKELKKGLLQQMFI